jgi:hypothetical protein
MGLRIRQVFLSKKIVPPRREYRAIVVEYFRKSTMFLPGKAMIEAGGESSLQSRL